MPVHITPLTPLAFLERSRSVFADATAVVDGDRRMTYRELGDEVTRVARALQASGIGPGDRVAYLCHNTPTLLVAHFAVPLAGAVLVAVNTRLAPREVLTICAHSGARMIVADADLAPALAPVMDELPVEEVVWDDAAAPVPEGLAGTRYADLVARGSDAPLPWTVEDEDATISINYTSGTTGAPKGVMYTHRGAYLNALGEIVHRRARRRTPSTSGRCRCSTATAGAPLGDRRPCGGTHVCLRAVRADAIWRLIDEEGVTHLNGAPDRPVPAGQLGPRPTPLERPLTVITAARAAQPHDPGPDRGPGRAGRSTSTGSPRPTARYTVCQWQPGWADEDARGQRARLLARQGVAMVIADPIRVRGRRPAPTCRATARRWARS